MPTPQEPLPQRKRPARGVFISRDEPTIVFLTVCTQDRVPWLMQEGVHDALVSAWSDATAWSVGFYVVMPDHVHLFCAPHDLSIPLDNWVKYWKSLLRRRGLSPEWSWQAGYWDTRLRRSENYHDKWEYVRLNPVRKGLVKKAEDWRCQGMLNVLRW